MQIGRANWRLLPVEMLSNTPGSLLSGFTTMPSMRIGRLSVRIRCARACLVDQSRYHSFKFRKVESLRTRQEVAVEGRMKIRRRSASLAGLHRNAGSQGMLPAEPVGESWRHLL